MNSIIADPVIALSAPKLGQILVLDHLRDAEYAKQVYGTYSALALIAYLLPSVEADSTWSA